jgi:hypothetical protein
MLRIENEEPSSLVDPFFPSWGAQDPTFSATDEKKQRLRLVNDSSFDDPSADGVFPI